MAAKEQFDAPTDTITDPVPVFYQSGYLTIKGYDPMFRSYTLPIRIVKFVTDSPKLCSPGMFIVSLAKIRSTSCLSFRT